MDIKLINGESFNIKNSDGTSIVSIAENGGLSGIQQTLIFDDVPTAESNNPVKSSGVKSAIDDAISGLTETINSISGLPQVTAIDNTKVLQVTDGLWKVVTPLVVYSGAGVPSSGVGNNGDLYIQTAEMMREPDILYETDGTSGLIGLNEGSLANSSWQVENLNMTPYRTVKFYFKEANVAALTGNSFTPAVVIEVPLDTAALAQNAATQMFVGGANTCHPNDQNNQYVILVAVDSTKTKAKVVMQKSLYGTVQGARNDSGRYCYKIEGWY